MPPFVPRKRHRSPPPAPSPSAQQYDSPKPGSKRTKPTLFDAVDSPAKKQKTLEENRKLLDELNDEDDDDDDDNDSSLSEVDSDDFEDVPPAKRQKISDAHGDDAESEDEMDWEDAIQRGELTQASKSVPEIGDVSISINEDGTYVDNIVSAGISTKGPSKRERQVRIQSHCLHVQTLLWHNTIRNSWLNDKEVQSTLVDALTDGIEREIRRWRDAMGMSSKEESRSKRGEAVSKSSKGKRARKGKEKSIGRDWNNAAGHADQNVPNHAHGDPLMRLLKVLAAFWRKRFTITAPGLRKQGYKPLRRLRDEIKGWEKSRGDVEEYGERIESLQQFRKLAKTCEGSRDLGAQLFVALLRGIGLEARLIANLQPVGFGWSKVEEADEKKAKQRGDRVGKVELESDGDIVEVKPAKSATAKKSASGSNTKKPTRKSSRGNKADPIDLDESDSRLSSLPSAPEALDLDDDDLSVLDITPTTPKKKQSTKKYDRDLAFPTYWTEVCSPVSNKWIPVDPIVLSTIASNDELLQTFEPRGKKSDKAKQVICYTIAFSADGTAKDVIVRYLKRHQLPGKTKGMRVPIEKVPVYNRRGKVTRYEEYDWFRTVMSLYDRPENKRTAADDLEEQSDLKPFKPAKEGKELEKESLQWYKQSADYVLEQHLRREEAIVPHAEPVKAFVAGKGDKAKEHPVYRREDVVTCKTVESWHKEGRALKPGEQPMKLVPMRAVTLIRKREMEDAQRETGEKLKQGLYSVHQTEWIIPPPIENGIIPKNAFGNMDVYVPTMVPNGAVHVPLKGTMKICKKLEIDYAEACTGFEFGKQRAVPVLTGVVVAEEHEILVRDAWKEAQREMKRKEDTQRTDRSLRWWRKMLLGLRVLERMRVEYANAGGKEEEYNPFVAKAQREARSGATTAAVEDVDGEDDVEAGGFLPPGYKEEEEEVPQTRIQTEELSMNGDDSLLHDSADDGLTGAGGFLVEEQPERLSLHAPSKNHAPITPVSLQSVHRATDGNVQGEDADDADISTVHIDKSRNRSVKPPKRPLKTRSAGRKGESSDGEGYESPFSKISSCSDIEEEEEESDERDSSKVSVPKKTKRPSPQVLLTAHSSNKHRARAHKSTPRKSQYFADDEKDGNDEEDDGQSGEIEVVKPRRTTARTRAKT